MIMQEVENLKQSARKAYRRYYHHFDSQGFDCGHTLAQEIDPELCRLANNFNDVMEKLHGLDSNCPKARI